MPRSALPALLGCYLLFYAHTAQETAASEQLPELPSNVYFRQLRPGVDIALSRSETHAFAAQMSNFVYLIGDPSTGEAVVIDGAWDVDGVRALVQADNMTLTASISTHCHWDHIGRSPRFKHPTFPQQYSHMTIPGIREWSEHGLQVLVPKWELEMAAQQTDTNMDVLTPLEDQECIPVGNGLTLELFHTPGHSPGGMAIKVVPEAVCGGEAVLLLSGDTVFPGSCGRLDLPGSDVAVMYDSLRKIAELPDHLWIFPGHGYGGRYSTVANERVKGLLRPMSRQQWMQQMRRG